MDRKFLDSFSEEVILNFISKHLPSFYYGNSFRKKSWEIYGGMDCSK